MTSLETQLINEAHRRLREESLARIVKCLNMLSDDEIWYKHNANSNSIGNLVLHLSGNIRQWLVSGLGQESDVRERDLEFSTIGPVSKEILIQKISSAINDGLAVVDRIASGALEQMYEVQVYHESGVSIIVHVIEHCSYHVGQITYLTKYLKDIDTEYYGEDLG